MARLLKIIKVFTISLLALFIVSGCISSSERKYTQELISPKNLNPQVLRLALNAYESAKQKGITKTDKIVIVDFSLPSSKRRLWVIDIFTKKTLFNTFVSHGKGSGFNYAQHFSNVPGSYKSSIGTFVTGKAYNGNHGYSMQLHGLEKGVNSNAFKRRIVVHSANYVNERFVKKHGRTGRSHGCLALDPLINSTIINTIKNGSLLFAYYPDTSWLQTSVFLKSKVYKV